MSRFPFDESLFGPITLGATEIAALKGVSLGDYTREVMCEPKQNYVVHIGPPVESGLDSPRKICRYNRGLLAL